MRDPAGARYSGSLFYSQRNALTYPVERTFVVVDRLEHLFGRNEQMCHFPHCHLEVHLREFEKSRYKVRQQDTLAGALCHSPLEEAWETDF